MANNSHNVIYTEEQIEQALNNLVTLSKTPKQPPNTALFIIKTRLYDKIMDARAQGYSWDDILESIKPSGIEIGIKKFIRIMTETQAEKEAAVGKGASRSRSKTVNAVHNKKQNDVTIVHPDANEHAVRASFGEQQAELGLDAKVETQGYKVNEDDFPSADL
jgi:hypothetical protein